MRKLRLDVEALAVESFEALPASLRRGTVAAHLPDVLYQDTGDTYDAWDGNNTVGTCIGPTYCCADTWNCPDTGTCPIVGGNTASRVVSAIVSPCTC